MTIVKKQMKKLKRNAVVKQYSSLQCMHTGNCKRTNKTRRATLVLTSLMSLHFVQNITSYHKSAKFEHDIIA